MYLLALFLNGLFTAEETLFAGSRSGWKVWAPVSHFCLGNQFFFNRGKYIQVQCADLKCLTGKSNKWIPLCNQHLNQDLECITPESSLVYTPLPPRFLSQSLF